MDIITIDYETFWDTDYSLSKMSPLAYVLGDRFETISCSIKVNDYPTDVLFGEDNVRHGFKSIKGRIDKSMLIAHNMLGFDSYVARYVHGLTPRMWGCTLAMARPVHAKDVGLSLAALVKHYRLGVKDNTVLMQTKGRRLKDFTQDEIDRMRIYNRDDTEQCYGLFKLLRPHLSSAELWHIDALTRMRVEPRFEVDVPMLETALSIERDQKRKHILMLAQKLRTTPGFESSIAVMEAATIDTLEEAVRADLASAPKFSALLTACGVEVPMKPSPSNPNKEVPALAKTDEEFIALQESDNPIVAAAARARLAVKSTLLETRIDKFLVAAKMTGGLLPVPLQYCGADTTGRDSGCLVADTEVLVYNELTHSRTNKRIVDVLASDLVWDGEEFVAHGGVVFSGYARVITWDGVTGTEDHVVFTEAGEVSLSDARSRGLPITIAGNPSEHQMDAARKHVYNHKKPTAL